MRLLLSWVRDFVPVTAPAQDIADTMALRGFEVASIEAIGDDDAVIDFEVTANRPDCLSVLGLARELGTVYSLPVREPEEGTGTAALAPIAIGESSRVRVTVEDPALCPRYAAAVADVAPGSTSPRWMTSRLEAAGVRPISPIVDITNYVLIEIGQPLHAFDLAQLEGGELRIRRARAGETLKTLDGVTRTLDEQMLVIADAVRPQAIGGVMGGAGSEVTAATRTVVFESACFAPASVRRTSKRLGLKTEASSRFERGADINGSVRGVQRALALLEQLGAGHGDGRVVDLYPSPPAPRVIRLRRDRLKRLLGLDVPTADTAAILRRLGFTVADEDGGWQVMVPSFRVDVLREVDLIEEVGRHYGLDKLEPAFPPMTAAAPPPDARIPRDQRVRRTLLAAGLSEAVTFGFIEAAAAAPFAATEGGLDVVVVANPLSAKFDTLRPSILPGLLSAVAHNRRHGRRDVALFEIGARFSPTAGESRGVALAWTGAAANEHWSTPSRDVDFFDVKGVVELLAEILEVSCTLDVDDRQFFVPGRAARVMVNGIEVGVLGQITPDLVERSGAPRQDPVYAAELSLDRLATLRSASSERVQPLPRYPFVVRDLSIVVSDALPAAIIRGTIQAAADTPAAPLVAVTFFDRYKGKGVPDGSVSLSVRLTFQAADRTLTDADVQLAFDKILAALVREHGALQR